MGEGAVDEGAADESVVDEGAVDEGVVDAAFFDAACDAPSREVSVSGADAAEVVTCVDNIRLDVDWPAGAASTDCAAVNSSGSDMPALPGVKVAHDNKSKKPAAPNATAAVRKILINF
jgi:hypothetical protein